MNMGNSVFEKYHAAGNDFIVFDFIHQRNKAITPENIAKLCDRHLGVGADGVVILKDWDEQSRTLKIDLFNSDGSVSSMCANGTRCALLKWAKSLPSKITKHQFFVTTLSGTYEGTVEGTTVWLSMPLNLVTEQKVDEKALHATFDYSKFFFVDSGVPHSIFFVTNLQSLKLDLIAPAIRHHKIFPKGCNVNFVEKIAENQYGVRTFERGVEAETLSCGTGVLAVSYVLKNYFAASSEIKFSTKGGELKSVVNKDSISYGGNVVQVFSAELAPHFL